MIKYIGIGEIPIRNYLVIMDKRCYSHELTIEYTKDIYGIDISQEIKQEKLCWNYKEINVYKRFEEKNPAKLIDDKSREYFQKEGRNRYNKFYKTYKESEVYDLIINLFSKPGVTHHIFPLVFGGDSSLMNLIPITDFNHKLLHINPCEKKREFCFMAVDYLSYLYSSDCISILNDKYNIMQYENFNGNFMLDFFKSIIETEMKSFYEKLGGM